MANIFDNFLKQIVTGDQVKDYKHASKLFIDSDYRLSPKYDWLYHVFFDVDPQMSNIDVNRLTETGMLVKSIKLPDYAIDTKTLNNYNRPEVVQTKINYNGINVAFHDDQAEVVRNFWYDYYHHYYRDSDIGFSNNAGQVNPMYHADYKYRENPILNNFGYTTRGQNGLGGDRYLQAIRIYSLHQKRFSEYTLINPVITSFSHGNHVAGSNGVLEHTMQIQFTSVLYAQGNVSSDTVKGFADLHYDKSPSPLTPAGGGTNSILGPGGIVSGIDAVISGLGTGSLSGILSAVTTAGKVLNKNKDVDLRGLAEGELIQATKDILNGNNPTSRFFVPTTGGIANSPILNAAGSFLSDPLNGIGSVFSSGTDSASPGSLVSNGNNVNFIDSAVQSITNPVAGVGTIAAGILGLDVNTNSDSEITGGQINKTVELDRNLQASSVTTSSDTGFSGKIVNIAGTLGEEAQLSADRISRSTTGSTQIQTGRTQFGQTVFESGTNTTVGDAPNILTRTPDRDKLIQAVAPDGLNLTQAAVDLSSAEAQKFIKDGNVQKLIDGTRNEGFSTNPEPGSTT